ncbi:hypothetical protein H634G_09519 [Metarhizium anisopliae BRIP 53293]|uniref:Major facilitator superfamily (MFS) profile domain-containing protein n=1 Tax=Metarhizium anisopliae BRIP 53293 TaxID=1291518 RepID=A0A0D9NN46_METAN|nr:hypothetical protein H634G_09519 [Metarhizium anisopliae BRIP 53293]KJK89569.1 hypothetical protein H633G_06561 [Metarhizium anisopliae BRIP 53284]
MESKGPNIPDAESIGLKPTAAPESAYSTFSSRQKAWIVVLVALAGTFSPMSSFVFYPAIDAISKDLHVTVGLVTVTTYMIVSGIVPTLMGSAADSFGRRPIYALALSVYLVANLGLALQDTYVGLLFLRMLQSAGSSGTISLGYGVLSDITTRAERGSYVGIFLIGPNVAPPVGPVLGGILTAKLGWKWIFWMLCILGGSCLGLILLALPETSRVIVGNGSIAPSGIYLTLLSVIARNKRGKSGESQSIHESTNLAPSLEHGPKFTLSNPLDCLKLLLLKDVAVVLSCNGIYYMIYCSIQASLSTLFIEIYNYGSLGAGLIYIPFGIACLAGTFIWGKVLDSEFARLAKKRCMPQGEVRRNADFPIEAARLSSALYLVVLSTLGTIAYGWSIHYRVHVSVPLVFRAIVGFSVTGLFALGTLLTDLNTTKASTASSSANLVRCALASIALAVLQPLIDRIGVGWCFTMFGLLGGLCGPVMIWDIK